LAPIIISPRGPSQRSSTISPPWQRRQSPPSHDQSVAGAAWASVVTKSRAIVRMDSSVVSTPRA
jgi:hypothetical protein